MATKEEKIIQDAEKRGAKAYAAKLAKKAEEVNEKIVAKTNSYLLAKQGTLNGRQAVAVLLPAAFAAIGGAKLQGYIADKTADRVVLDADGITPKSTGMRLFLAHGIVPLLGTGLAYWGYRSVGVKRNMLAYGAFIVGVGAGAAIGSVVNSIQVDLPMGTPQAV